MAREAPIRVETGKQNSATAIAKGQIVVQNDVADFENVILSGAQTAKIYGVALEASPGQSTAAKPVVFPVVTLGPCKVKLGGTVTQGDWVESDASGNGISWTTGSIRKVVGVALESGVSGDLCTVNVRPGAFWV